MFLLQLSETSSKMFPTYFRHLFIQKYCRKSTVQQVCINNIISVKTVVHTIFDLQKDNIIMPNTCIQLFKKLCLFHVAPFTSNEAHVH